MNYWLFKSEPDEFSIDALKKAKREPWTGVRNYQARNFMRDGMRLGDLAFFYHSNCALPGIVGLCSIVKEAVPDLSQFDKNSAYFDAASQLDNPRWLAVEVAFKRKLRRTISLHELQQHARQLGDFALIRRGNRLSVLPVSKPQWDFILTLEKGLT